MIETGKRAKQADGSVAVSYTHLDVYKRQDLGEGCMADTVSGRE